MASPSDSAADPGFHTTQWSLVARAVVGSPQSRQALTVLCENYWYPLYAYVRRQGRSCHDAQDLTQAFFARLLEKDVLAVADPKRGRFRTFLLASLKHYLANEYDAQRAQKRGAGRLCSLELADAEDRFAREPASIATPDLLYQRRWALTVLQQTLDRLRAEMAARGKSRQFESLKHLLDGDGTTRHAELAVELGMSEAAVKVAAHRLRRRYRDLLRQQIGQTVANPADIDDEIRDLFAALAVV